MRLDIAGLCLCLIFKQIHGPVSVTFEEGIKRSLGKSLSLLTEGKKSHDDKPLFDLISFNLALAS